MSAVTLLARVLDRRRLHALAGWLLLGAGAVAVIGRALSGHFGTPQLSLAGGLPLAFAVAGLVCPVSAAAIATRLDPPSPGAVPVVVTAMTMYGVSFASEFLRLARLMDTSRVVVFDSGYLEFFGGVAVLGFDVMLLALVAAAGLYASRVTFPRARRHLRARRHSARHPGGQRPSGEF